MLNMCVACVLTLNGDWKELIYNNCIIIPNQERHNLIREKKLLKDGLCPFLYLNNVYHSGSNKRSKDQHALDLVMVSDRYFSCLLSGFCCENVDFN